MKLNLLNEFLLISFGSLIFFSQQNLSENEKTIVDGCQTFILARILTIVND